MILRFYLLNLFRGALAGADLCIWFFFTWRHKNKRKISYVSHPRRVKSEQKVSCVSHPFDNFTLVLPLLPPSTLLNNDSHWRSFPTRVFGFTEMPLYVNVNLFPIFRPWSLYLPKWVRSAWYGGASMRTVSVEGTSEVNRKISAPSIHFNRPKFPFNPCVEDIIPGRHKFNQSTLKLNFYFSIGTRGDLLLLLLLLFSISTLSFLTCQTHKINSCNTPSDSIDDENGWFPTCDRPKQYINMIISYTLWWIMAIPAHQTNLPPKRTALVHLLLESSRRLVATALLSSTLNQDLAKHHGFLAYSRNS